MTLTFPISKQARISEAKQEGFTNDTGKGNISEYQRQYIIKIQGCQVQCTVLVGNRRALAIRMIHDGIIFTANFYISKWKHRKI